MFILSKILYRDVCLEPVEVSQEWLFHFVIVCQAFSAAVSSFLFLCVCVCVSLPFVFFYFNKWNASWSRWIQMIDLYLAQQFTSWPSKKKPRLRCFRGVFCVSVHLSCEALSYNLCCLWLILSRQYILVLFSSIYPAVSIICNRHPRHTRPWRHAASTSRSWCAVSFRTKVTPNFLLAVFFLVNMNYLTYLLTGSVSQTCSIHHLRITVSLAATMFEAWFALNVEIFLLLSVLFSSHHTNPTLSWFHLSKESDFRAWEAFYMYLYSWKRLSAPVNAAKRFFSDPPLSRPFVAAELNCVFFLFWRTYQTVHTRGESTSLASFRLHIFIYLDNNVPPPGGCSLLD